MPHALSDRQRAYLNFIQSYIAQNELSPKLEDLAEYFDVKLPTAHKTLKALQNKGYLLFDRTSSAGFFIRLIERAGMQEVVLRVPLAGKINRFGEVYDFPDLLGEIPAIFTGVERENMFALVLIEDIPQANMERNDFLFFAKGKKPQPGDICISVIGEKYFLVRVISKTLDDRFLSPVVALDYPIPESLSDPDLEQRLYYQFLAFTEDNHDLFKGFLGEQAQQNYPLPEDFAFATALRLIRSLSY